MTFKHGVTLQRQTAAIPRPLSPIDLSTIGLLGTAKAGSATVGDPVAVRSRAEAATLFGSDLTDGTAGDNTIPRALDRIFRQGDATVVVCKATFGATKAATLSALATGGYDVATKKYKGADMFDAAVEKTGLSPGILIAPEYTGRTAAAKTTANALAAKMEEKAATLRAVHLVDGLEVGATVAPADAITAAVDGGARGLYLWSALLDGTDVAAPSAPVAGLIARIDAENGGPWASPSNRVVRGMTGAVYPVPYDPEAATGLANTLNNGDTVNDTNYVTTFISVAGLRLWGNRVAAPSDPAWKYLSVLRTGDLIEQTIRRSFLWAVDRNITTGLVDAVVESVNDFLRSLQGREGIAGGEAFPHPTLNTKASVIDGKGYVAVRWSPLYPLEELQFLVELTDDFLTVFRGSADA